MTVQAISASATFAASGVSVIDAQRFDIGLMGWVGGMSGDEVPRPGGWAQVSWHYPLPPVAIAKDQERRRRMSAARCA